MAVEGGATGEGVLDEAGGGGGGEKRLESRHVLKVQLTGFPDTSDAGVRERDESRMTSGCLA